MYIPALRNKYFYFYYLQYLPIFYIDLDKKCYKSYNFLRKKSSMKIEKGGKIKCLETV